jgi:hypothetical protein
MRLILASFAVDSNIMFSNWFDDDGGGCGSGCRVMVSFRLIEIK